MDSAVIFALVLTVLFFGGITWIVIRARQRIDTQTENQPLSMSKADQRKERTD